MTGTGVPHEGTNEEVIDEHQVPSGQIGRMGAQFVAIYRSAR